jgi:hypothetical protein
MAESSLPVREGPTDTSGAAGPSVAPGSLGRRSEGSDRHATGPPVGPISSPITGP